MFDSGFEVEVVDDGSAIDGAAPADVDRPTLIATRINTPGAVTPPTRRASANRRVRRRAPSPSTIWPLLLEVRLIRAVPAVEIASPAASWTLAITSLREDAAKDSSGKLQAQSSDQVTRGRDNREFDFDDHARQASSGGTPKRSRTSLSGTSTMAR